MALDQDITAILLELRTGEPTALDRVFALVYEVVAMPRNAVTHLRARARWHCGTRQAGRR